jgi:predicted amidophosphoribosyltransferase
MNLFAASCLICQTLLWKRKVLCAECFNQCQDVDLLFREEKGLPIFSTFHYVPNLEGIVRIWKNSKEEASTKLFAAILAQKLAWQCLTPISGVIPIPAKKFGQKDHAYLIAETVANYFKAPLAADFLERKDSSEQKLKTLENRQQIKMGLKGDFKTHDSEKGLWLLVDDVVTSGGTLVNAWNLLGCPRAIGATLASTPRYSSLLKKG